MAPWQPKRWPGVRGELVSVTWDGSPLDCKSDAFSREANVRQGEQDVVVAAVEENDWPSAWTSSGAVVGADHRWLCAVTPPLLFFPVCSLHDESPVAFVCVSVLALERSPRWHPGFEIDGVG